MDARSSASRLLVLRRASCPTVITGQTAMQKRHREKEQLPYAEITKVDSTVNFSTVTNELHQRSKMPRRFSSDDVDIQACLSRLQRSEIPKSTDSTFPFHASKSVASINEEPYNEFGFEQHVRLHLEKNEAEIIGDFPVNQRRGSLPAISGFMPGFAVSGAVFVTADVEVQARRKGQGTAINSVDRELKCLYKNSKEDKRLQQTFSQLDKQLFVGNLGFRQQRHKIVSEYKKLVQVSPTVEEWLAAKRSQTYQRHEPSVKGSHRTCSRQLNHVPGLPLYQFAQSRSLLETDVLAKSESSGDDESRGAAAELTSPSKARRHTISGDLLSRSLSQYNKNRLLASASHGGRRQTSK